MDQQLIYCPTRRQALLQGDEIAIKSAHQELTFAQLDQHIDSLSKQFMDAGLVAGDRLICIAENAIKLILLQLTCIRNAIIFCPLNPRFSALEIQQRLQILASPFIWHEQPSESLTDACLPLYFTLDNNNSDNIVSNNAPHPIDPLQVVSIIFTSGSSGQPKAIMHHFSNHFYSALGSQAQIPLHHGDTNLLSLPLFHISGYATVIRTLLAGATLYISKHRLTVELLKKQKITHLSLVATQLYRLLADNHFQHDNLSIKHLLLGGSAFSKQLLMQVTTRGFTYHLSYGLTEMSSQVATSTNDSCLQVLKFSELTIVNDEILLRGKTRFVGYFNGKQGCSLLAKDAWFASKDIGKISAQRLQIIGRKDRQFISGGENIQPEEIERLLLAFPCVKQAYIVSIDEPVFGQRPVAFIDCDNLSALISQFESVLAHQLSRYKRPIHYFSLPVQSTLKVSLTALQQIAQQRYKEIKCPPDRA